MEISMMLRMCFGATAERVTDVNGNDITCCRRCGSHVPHAMVYENVVGRPLSSQELHAMWHMAVEPVV